MPERLRVLTLFDSLLLWGNLSVSLLVIVIGALLVPALSFRDALLAIIVGAVAGNLLLGLAAPEDSTQNRLVGTIASVVPVGNRVRVRVGPLTAEVTAASAERLGFEPGERVVASFKATGTRLFPLG